MVGCGESASSSAPATVTVTTTVTETPVAASTPIEATSSEPVVETSSGPATSDGPPVISGGTSGTRTLTLADVFKHDGWEEGSYQPAGSKQARQAMGVALNSCGTPYSLEVRLAQITGTAKITVAQAIDSVSSVEKIEFKLLADGRLVDAKTIAFNQTQSLSADLTGVSTLVLEVKWAEGEQCRATALVTSFTITPSGP